LPGRGPLSGRRPGRRQRRQAARRAQAGIPYSITNTLPRSVEIVGYTASCECTHVESTGSVIPPLGQVKVRALINRGEPTVQFVILQDAGTNLYETLLFILPNK
jgi:hypothetical protein